MAEKAVKQYKIDRVAEIESHIENHAGLFVVTTTV